MSKFTKGPWKLNGECFTAGGHYDAPRIFSNADPDNPQFIAEIAVRELWEENGNLIAAAPEMYEALATLCNDDEPIDWKAALAKARTALAKAEGL